MLFDSFKWLLQCSILLFGHFGKKRKGKEFMMCLVVLALGLTNLEHCKLKLTINANRGKCSRDGKTGIPGEKPLGAE